jgi:hypothetical protein
MSTKPIKSAFAPMTPKVTTLSPRPLKAAKPESPPPGKSQEPPPSIPTVEVPIELRLEVCNRRDRDPASWAYLARGVQAERAIVGVLNRNCALTDKALFKATLEVVRFLYALAIVERLLWSARALPAQETYAHLRKLFLEEAIEPWRAMILLASRLAAHELLKPIAGLPIFGANQVSDTRHLVGSIMVSMSAASTTAPWLKRKQPVSAAGGDGDC